MSDDGWAAAVPPFKATESLVALKRQLRDLRPLAERGPRYELRGVPVLEVSADDTTITVRLAQRPTAAPSWTTRTLTSAAELRRFVDDFRGQLRRWEGDE